LGSARFESLIRVPQIELVFHPLAQLNAFHRLEGRWALDGLDQQTMRWLSKEAKRKRVGVADVIYEAVESFVAKCEAEAELETKIIKFPNSF
jgi:hypothetical protein